MWRAVFTIAFPHKETSSDSRTCVRSALGLLSSFIKARVKLHQFDICPLQSISRFLFVRSLINVGIARIGRPSEIYSFSVSRTHISDGGTQERKASFGYKCFLCGRDKYRRKCADDHSATAPERL